MSTTLGKPTFKYAVRCTDCDYAWTGTLDDKCPECELARVAEQQSPDKTPPASNPSPFEDFLIKPPTILDEAAAIISGPRRESYGPVEESFERTATVASIWLHRKLSSPLDGKDVAMFMLAVKMCRETNLPAYDNRLDAIGYLALLDQLHSTKPNLTPSNG